MRGGRQQRNVSSSPSNSNPTPESAAACSHRPWCQKQAARTKLQAAVRAHAETDDGRIFIVLATKGYEPMLRNFLCSVSRVMQSRTNDNSSSSQPTMNRAGISADAGSSRGRKLPVLVLTFDAAVAATARAAGAGAYIASLAELSVDLENEEAEDEKNKNENCFKNTSDCSTSEGNANANADLASASSEAAFGSQAYQLLMLFRTRTVWQVLSMGYSPVIADIDTVWVQNPLVALRDAESSVSADITVALDGTPRQREICGCFVALRPRPRSSSASADVPNTHAPMNAALALWTEVKNRHVSLLRAWQLNGSSFEVSSEQKIITELLAVRTYPRTEPQPGSRTVVDAGGNLILRSGFHNSEQHTKNETVFTHLTGIPIKMAVLPTELFPSGYDYFNHDQQQQSSCSREPIIIHNNFIIGNSAKIDRFRRFGLWYPLPNKAAPPVNEKEGARDRFVSGEDEHVSLSQWSDAFCNYDHAASSAHMGFTTALYEAMPTLVLHSPMHQSFVDVEMQDTAAAHGHTQQRQQYVSFTNIISREGVASMYRPYGSSKGNSCRNQDFSKHAHAQADLDTAAAGEVLSGEFHFGSDGKHRTYTAINSFNLLHLQFPLREDHALGLLHRNNGVASDDSGANTDAASDISSNVRGCTGNMSCLKDNGETDIDYYHYLTRHHTAIQALPATSSDLPHTISVDADIYIRPSKTNLKSHCGSDTHSSSMSNSSYSCSCSDENAVFASRHRYVYNLRNTHAQRWNALWLPTDDYNSSRSSSEVSSSNLAADIGTNANADTDRDEDRDRDVKIDPKLWNFNIKVLTFNRPHSLRRLLRSLLSADYSAATGRNQLVNLEIIADGPPDRKVPVQEQAKYDATNDVARDFHWPYGNYLHTKRYDMIFLLLEYAMYYMIGMIIVLGPDPNICFFSPSLAGLLISGYPTCGCTHGTPTKMICFLLPHQHKLMT